MASLSFMAWVDWLIQKASSLLMYEDWIRNWDVIDFIFQPPIPCKHVFIQSIMASHRIKWIVKKSFELSWAGHRKGLSATLSLWSDAGRFRPSLLRFNLLYSMLIDTHRHAYVCKYFPSFCLITPHGVYGIRNVWPVGWIGSSKLSFETRKMWRQNRIAATVHRRINTHSTPIFSPSPHPTFGFEPLLISCSLLKHHPVIGRETVRF